MDVTEFFKALHLKASKVTMTCDRQILMLGFSYLETESKLPAIKRDQYRIHDTWRAIHPLIIKYRLLDVYRNDVILKSRAQIFLSPPRNRKARDHFR